MNIIKVLGLLPKYMWVHNTGNFQERCNIELEMDRAFGTKWEDTYISLLNWCYNEDQLNFVDSMFNVKRSEITEIIKYSQLDYEYEKYKLKGL